VSVNFQFLQKPHFNLRGRELITCSQIFNRTLTMCSYKTMNYVCAKLAINIKKMNIYITHRLGYNLLQIYHRQ